MLQKVWRKENIPTLLVEMQTSIATMEKLWSFLKKLEVELPYYPAKLNFQIVMIMTFRPITSW